MEINTSNILELICKKIPTDSDEIRQMLFTIPLRRHSQAIFSHKKTSMKTMSKNNYYNKPAKNYEM